MIILRVARTEGCAKVRAALSCRQRYGFPAYAHPSSVTKRQKADKQAPNRRRETPMRPLYAHITPSFPLHAPPAGKDRATGKTVSRPVFLRRLAGISVTASRIPGTLTASTAKHPGTATFLTGTRDGGSEKMRNFATHSHQYANKGSRCDP